MPTLLRLDSSTDLSTSRTRALTAVFVDAWLARGSDHTVVVRDLHIDPLPHLRTPAQHWPRRLRGGMEVPAELDALQQTVIDELLGSDAIVIGAPMYNFGIASTLKAWVDLIHVPGVTVPFDVPTQPMAGRPAVIVTARGGADGPENLYVTGPLTTVLGDGLGMRVSVVSTSRTLADRLPELGVDRAEAEFEEARQTAQRVARSS